MKLNLKPLALLLTVFLVSCSSSKETPNKVTEDEPKTNVEMYDEQPEPTADTNWGLQENSSIVFNYYSYTTNFGIKAASLNEITDAEAKEKYLPLRDNFKIFLKSKGYDLHVNEKEYSRELLRDTVTLDPSNPNNLHYIGSLISVYDQFKELSYNIQYKFNKIDGKIPTIDIKDTLIPDAIDSINGRTIDIDLVQNQLNFYINESNNGNNESKNIELISSSFYFDSHESYNIELSEFEDNSFMLCLDVNFIYPINQ